VNTDVLESVALVKDRVKNSKMSWLLVLDDYVPDMLSPIHTRERSLSGCTLQTSKSTYTGISSGQEGNKILDLDSFPLCQFR